MFDFPNDDDQLDPRRRTGMSNIFDIAAPGPQRRPAELPGIDVPEVSTQHSAVSGQPAAANKPAASIAGPDVTNVTSVTKPAASIAGPSDHPGSPDSPVLAGGGGHPITGSPDHQISSGMSGPTLNDDITMHRNKLDYYRSTGSGISQIHNPFLRGLAHVADIAGSALFPFQTAMIPGTELHHRQLMGQETGAINQDLGEEHSRAQTEQEHAGAEHTQAETEALKHPQPKPAEEKWTDLKDYTGPNGEPLQMEEHSGQVRIAGGDVLGIKRAPQNAQPKEGELPLGDRVGQLNAALTERYQVLNPKKPLPAHYTLPANATQKDYERIDKALEEEERARGIKTQQDTTNANRADARNQAAEARTSAGAEKSYQSAAKRVDNMTKPISDAIARMGRLEETLRQGTPQADALVAPELLTVMAGGAGSGLRMNEAEIQRVVGGRSHWEGLQATLNQWSTDPTKANSITPAQRQQMRALVNVVHQKLLKKQAVLNDADARLLDSDDPHEHKRIVVEAKQALSDIDEGKEPGQGGGRAPAGTIQVKAPNGKTYNFDDQAAADRFKKEAGIK